MWVVITNHYNQLILTDYSTSYTKVYSPGAFYHDITHFELFLKLKSHQILQKNVKDECTSRWLHAAMDCWTWVAAVSWRVTECCVNDTYWYAYMYCDSPWHHTTTKQNDMSTKKSKVRILLHFHLILITFRCVLTHGYTQIDCNTLCNFLYIL